MKKVILVCLLMSIMAFGSAEFCRAAAKVSDPPLETLTLEKCLKMGWLNNQGLKTAAQNVAAARAAVREAEGAFWPLGTYELGYQTADRGAVISYCYDLGEIRKPAQGFGLNLKLTQPIYTGGKLTGNLAIAKQKLAAAVEDERKARQTLAYRIKESFCGVWLAGQMAQVARDAYDNLERHVQQVKNLRKVGTGSKYDLLQAEVQRDRMKPVIIKAENQLALAKLNLATLIGVAPDSRLSVAFNPEQFPIPDQNPWSLETAVAAAYQNRPEMRQIAQLALIRKAQLQIAQAGFKPDLALSVAYKHEGEDLFNAAKSDRILSLTVGLAGVFFDRQGVKARIDQAQIGIEAVKTGEIDLREQIRLEVAQAIQNFAESLETIRAHQAGIDLAKEALRMTQIRFEAGLATTMDVSDAQMALNQARNGYYEGIYSYIQAGAALDLVTGKDI